jgi:hypothetical protein
MGQEQYGTWAAGLERTTVGKALLAFGIVADVDPSFALTASDGLTDRLRSVLEANTEANRELSFRQLPPVGWTDPLALSAWDPDAVGAGASQWAAAFEAVTPFQRLMMTVDRESDLIWLTDTFLLVSEFALLTVSYEARQATPWRFPLRVGFLPDSQPDNESRALLAELIAGFGGSSWRSTLIAPFLLSAARVSCDLLVLSGNPWDVPKRLEGLPEVRAGAVLVAGPNTLAEKPNLTLIARIAELAGAWAVAFADVPDVPSWLVNLVQTLSHAAPLDGALTWASGGTAVLVAADPTVIVRETVEQRATRLAQTLNALAEPDVLYDVELPIRNLARQLAHIAATGEFISEAGDASEIANLEVQAGELLDLAGSARRLQARISRTDQPTISLTAFQPATAHAIEVRIGPLRDAEWLAATAPFPEEALEPDQPHELTVVLTEPHLLPAPQVATIDLPVVGTSTTAIFTLTTAPDTATVDARLIVLSGNRVLQTARLPAEIGPARGAQRRAVSEPEVVIAPAISAIADRRTFGAAFLVNRSLDGKPRATAVAGKNVGMVNLSSDTISAALKKLSIRLNEIVDAPNDFGAIDSEASEELLTFLAFHGAKMRTALVTDSPGLDDVLKDPENCLQVVSAKADAYFPFEFAYEFHSPQPGARLCPRAVATLRSTDGNDLLCAEEHGPEVVCPTGFWGLHRVIERHAYQPAEHVPASFLVRSTPTRNQRLIKLGSAVFGASQRVDEVVPGGTQAVADALAAGGPYTQVVRWDDWRTAASAASAPALLMLLPHTAYDDSLEAFGLEIGADDVAYDFDGCLPSDEHPVIVVLLGCETARAGELSYETFPAQLRYAGAEIVIATLTDVLGRHASPIANRLTRELSRQRPTDAQGMGEVMLKLRRNLVADGLLPVLALACFGDADWLVGA